MFAVPPEFRTEVFSRIPDEFRKPGRRSQWVELQRRGRTTDTFLEGPSFDRQGNLYVVDVPWGRVFKITVSGAVDLVAEYDGEPNGLKIHRDGRIFIADFKNGIMLLDPGSGRVTPFCDRTGLERFKGVNDLVFSSSGDMYFTDQGFTGLHDASGRLYRLCASGRLDLLLDNIPSPNGVVLSPDESSVLLSVTRDNAVWRVPLTSEGLPFKVGRFVNLSGGIGPDGLAVDEAGNLAVAHVGMGSVWLFSPVGEPIGRIRSCAGSGTSNLAYGGPDRRTLFITESETGQVLTARLDIPGREMFSHAL
jgi:gluconolactonase